MTVESPYDASPWGNRYHQQTCRELLGGGAAGPGKTMCLLADIVPRIAIEHDRAINKRNPYYFGPRGSTGWALHLRRTVKQLTQTIARSLRLFPVVDPDAKYDATSTTWTFGSGYKYQFGHCKDSLSWNDYFSSEYDWIGFDELVQFEEEQYFQIAGRCRSSDPVLMKMLKVRSMSNPVQRHEGDDFSFRGDPHWVRDYFIRPCREGNKILRRKIVLEDGSVETRDRMYMPARLQDNPNKAFIRQYETTLRTMKPHIQQALLFGNWWITAGSYFGDEWNQGVHVVRPYKIPPDWPVARAMDWGFKKPGWIGWGAMDDDENLAIIQELKFKGKTDKEVAMEVRRIERHLGLWNNKENRSMCTGVADPQLWERRGDSGKSKAAVFQGLGVPWKPADRRSRRNNAERISKRLKDHDSGSKTPGLVIFSNCDYLIETLPAIQTDKNGEDPQDGGDDHAFDALGYLCAHASRGRAFFGRAPIEQEEESDDDFRGHARGRDGYGGCL